MADPSLLMHDKARFEWTGDGFELEDAVSTDLAYVLGLRNGDVLSGIKDAASAPYESLATDGKVLDAFLLLSGSSSTTFWLEVERPPSQTVVLEYRID